MTADPHFTLPTSLEPAHEERRLEPVRHPGGVWLDWGPALPDEYAQDRLCLMVRDPWCVFAYWQLTGPHAKRRGLRVVCIVNRHFTPPEMAQICDTFVHLGIGRLGAAIRFFKRHGVAEVSWAGGFPKEQLFRRWRLFSLLPARRFRRLPS